jgi:hypothetical protein
LLQYDIHCIENEKKNRGIHRKRQQNHLISHMTKIGGEYKDKRKDRQQVDLISLMTKILGKYKDKSKDRQQS